MIVGRTACDLGMPSAYVFIEMERIAISIWQERVSPVFDTASRLSIYDQGAGQRAVPQTVDLVPLDIGQRARFIRDLGINTLLCGAISRPLYSLLVNFGVTVRPWITGNVDEVLAAYESGTLNSGRFFLPGCGRRRQRRKCGGAFRWKQNN